MISSKAIRKKKCQENCNISPLLFIKRLSNNELNFTPKVWLNTSGAKFKVRQSLFYYTIQYNSITRLFQHQCILMNILSFTFSARNSLAYIKGYFRIPKDHYNKNEKKEISDPIHSLISWFRIYIDRKLSNSNLFAVKQYLLLQRQSFLDKILLLSLLSLLSFVWRQYSNRAARESAL